MGRRRTLGKKRRRRTNKRSSMMRMRRTINKMRGGINDINPSSRNFLAILNTITSTDTELQTLITQLFELGEGKSKIIDDENTRKVTHQGDNLIYSDKFGSNYVVGISNFKKLVDSI